MLRFFRNMLIGAILVTVIGHGNYKDFLFFVQDLYISLARTIDPNYNLTIGAEKVLVWLAAFVGLAAVLRFD